MLSVFGWADRRGASASVSGDIARTSGGLLLMEDMFICFLFDPPEAWLSCRDASRPDALLWQRRAGSVNDAEGTAERRERSDRH